MHEEAEVHTESAGDSQPEPPRKRRRRKSGGSAKQSAQVPRQKRENLPPSASPRIIITEDEMRAFRGY